MTYSSAGTQSTHADSSQAGIRGAIAATTRKDSTSAASPVRVPVSQMTPRSGSTETTSSIVAAWFTQRQMMQTSGTPIMSEISLAFNGGMPPYRRPDANEPIPVTEAIPASRSIAEVRVLSSVAQG